MKSKLRTLLIVLLIALVAAPVLAFELPEGFVYV